ncbi:MAG: hypothetical protein ACR2JY_05215, partial [Chloroflexota bacterium]
STVQEVKTIVMMDAGNQPSHDGTNEMSMITILRTLDDEGWVDAVVKGMLALGGEVAIADLWTWGLEHRGSIGAGPRKDWRGNAAAVLILHSDGHGDNLFERVGGPNSLTFKLVDPLRSAPNLVLLVKKAKSRTTTDHINHITGLERYLLAMMLYEVRHFYTAATICEQALLAELDADCRTNAERLYALCLTKLEW